MSSTATFEEPAADRNDNYWYHFGYDALELTVDSYGYRDTDQGGYGLHDTELRAYDTEWSQLSIEGSVHVPDGLLEYVFEDGADPNDHGELIVRADCLETHSRFVAASVTDELETGSVPFDATFDRSELSGTVELSPVLVRTEADESSGTDDYRYGQTPGLKLADGPGFDIHVDQPRGEEGSFLDIRSKRFENPPPEDNVFDLEHSPADDPTFYVNSRVDLLVAALKNRAPHGSKRWTREVLERLLSHPVWIELVLWTAADLQDGECRHAWQETVLEVLSTEMYDHADVDAVAQDLEERISDPERIPLLIEELNESVQQYLDPRDDLENLFEEVL